MKWVVSIGGVCELECGSRESEVGKWEKRDNRFFVYHINHKQNIIIISKSQVPFSDSHIPTPDSRFQTTFLSSKALQFQKQVWPQSDRT